MRNTSELVPADDVGPGAVVSGTPDQPSPSRLNRDPLVTIQVGDSVPAPGCSVACSLVIKPFDPLNRSSSGGAWLVTFVAAAAVEKPSAPLAARLTATPMPVAATSRAAAPIKAGGMPRSRAWRPDTG